MRYGIVDLGTLSVRFDIYQLQSKGGPKLLRAYRDMLRLGESIYANGRIDEAAADRSCEQFRKIAALAKEYHTDEVIAVATSALRDALGGQSLLERIRAETGIAVTIISGVEEARLTAQGILANEQRLPERLALVDIGGGSTEIMWLDRFAADLDAEPGDSISLPLGVVTLSESYGPEIDQDGYERMVALVRRSLEERRHGRLLARGGGPRMQMLGTSGTVTTLAAVHLGLKRYDRRKVDGVSLPFSAVREAASRLRLLDNAARAAHPCIGVGRADLVVAGSAILDAVHGFWPVERLRVADRGLREGILGTLMGQSLRQALLGPAHLA